MPRVQKNTYLLNYQVTISPPPCRNRRRIAWLQFFFAVFLCLTLVVNVCGDWSFNISVAFAATTAHAKPGTLTFAQFLKQGRQDTAYHGRFIRPQHVPPPPGTSQDKVGKTLPTAEPPTMKPLTQPLTAAFLSGGSGAQPLDLISSDGRLEVVIQPGTFDLSHASVMSDTNKGKGTGKGQGTSKASSMNGSGTLTLTITELYGYYIAENDTLGAYQFQLTDASGHLVSGVTLHMPITIAYHYSETIMTGFDLDPGHLFLGWPTLLDIATRTHPAPSTALIALHNDPKTHTVTAQSHLFGPGPFTFTGDPSNQSPSAAELASVQGNSGQLSYALPIQMPPGPDGFGPGLTLSYSSQGANARHNFNQPSGSVGDGWSLTVGAITADVHGSSSAGGAATWYTISGVDGISDRLAPGNQDPTTFATQHYSYLLIKQVQYGSPQRPCFHVWDTSGTYYEFGCISDALQYHKDSDGTIHYYRWDLNKIVAPNEGDSSNEKAVIISYLQDCVPYSAPCPDGPSANNGTAIRDSSPKQITVMAGSSVDETIDLLYMAPNASNINGIQFATAYPQNYNCDSGPPANTTLRCDDPINFPGGLPAPPVMSTLSLIHIYSYLGPDTGSGSHPAYSYDLDYTDTPFSATGFNTEQCFDPTQPFGPSVYEYCAGEHLLESVTESVNNNNSWHELKPVLFNYTQYTNFYTDQDMKVPGTGNIYQIHVHVSLLTDYLDSNTGLGGHITFKTGYGNTHGTPNAYDDHGNLIDDRHDPLFCDTHGGCFTGNNGIYANPNDAQWGEQLVTSITTLGSDSSGLQAATTTYAYSLVTLNGQTCPAAGSGNTYENECVTFTWRPQSDTDWQDYYNGENFGMNAVFTSSPAGNVTADYYYSTEGNNTNYGHYGNYMNGSLYEEDVFQGNSTSGTLLRTTTTDYAGDPNTYPANSCNGNYSLVYTPCEVMPMTTTTAFCEGAPGCSTYAQNPLWPWITTTYTYDDYKKNQGLGDYYTAGSYHNLLQEQTTISSSSSSPYLTKSWNYLPENQTIDNTTYYDVNKAVQSEIDDASGMKWMCEGITYDEGNQAGTTSGNPVAGWPTTVNWYKGGNCSYPSFGTPFITTYSGYDAYGNVIATVDGVAAANPSFYGASGKNNANGCTLPSAPTIIGAGWNKNYYTTCTVYDPYQVQPVSVANAFGQSNQFSYDRSQALLPVTSEDPNQKTTTTAYSYDSNSGNNDERIISVSEPGECGPPCYTKQSNTYSTCSTSIPSLSTVTSPCFEVNGNSSLYPNQVSSTWYDSQGRSVESSIPAPPPVGAQSGMDYFTVSITEYNDQNDTAWKSEPFVVAVTPQ